jgi:hypothetical protein
LQKVGITGDTVVNATNYPKTTFVPILSRNEKGDPDGKGFYIVMDGHMDRYNLDRNTGMPGDNGSKGILNYGITLSGKDDQDSVTIENTGTVEGYGGKKTNYLIYENPNGKLAANLLTKAAGPIAVDSDDKLQSGGDVSLQMEVRDKLAILALTTLNTSKKCSVMNSCSGLDDFGEKVPVRVTNIFDEKAPPPAKSIVDIVKDYASKVDCSTGAKPSGAKPGAATNAAPKVK